MSDGTVALQVHLMIQTLHQPMLCHMLCFRFSCGFGFSGALQGSLRDCTVSSCADLRVVCLTGLCVQETACSPRCALRICTPITSSTASAVCNSDNGSMQDTHTPGDGAYAAEGAIYASVVGTVVETPLGDKVGSPCDEV